MPSELVQYEIKSSGVLMPSLYKKKYLNFVTRRLESRWTKARHIASKMTFSNCESLRYESIASYFRFNRHA